MFTFMTISYNQENYIIEHLESIKYQILNYATENIQFILADDGSVDNTVELSKCWLNKNLDLFDKIEVIVNETNMGVSNNAANGFSAIEGEYFIYVAADDLYSKENIFDYIKNLKDYDVLDALAFEFFGDERGGLTRTEESMYKHRLAKSYFKDKWMRVLVAASMPYGGPTYAFRSNYISEETLNYLRKFKMCEDYPMATVISQKAGLRRKFVCLPVILQRVSKSSITRSGPDSPAAIKCREDICVICKSNFNNRSFAIRFASFVQYQQLRTGGMFWKVINPYNLYIFWLSIIHRRRIRLLYEQCIQPKIIENEEHLANIIGSSLRFMKSERLCLEE